MPVLSWIVASNRRPHLLGAALEHMRLSTPPAGWTAEIVIGADADDVTTPGIAKTWDARVVTTKKCGGGPKRNAAIHASTGELLLIADDDDMPAATRAAHAVRAYELGYPATSTREFRYLHLESGMVVRWKGRTGTTAAPPPSVGTARNLSRPLLKRVNGYRDIPRLLEKDLQARIHHRLAVIDRDLATVIGDAAMSMWTQTICVQHGKNVWGDRPCLSKGETQIRGGYFLVGEGHHSELDDFPPSVTAALR